MIEINLKESPEELIQTEQLIIVGKFKEAYLLMGKFKDKEERTPKDTLLCDLLKIDIMMQQSLFEDVIKLANQTYKKSLELRENVLAFDALNLETQALLFLHKLDESSEKIKEGEELLKILPQELPRDYKERCAALEALKCRFYYRKGDADKIEKHLELSVALFEEIGDNRELAKTLIQSTLYYANLKGEFDLAFKNVEKGLEIAKNKNWKYGRAIGLIAKGMISHLKGDINNSIIYHKQSLTLFKELNNLFYISHIFNNLAGLFRVTGDLELALENAEQSIALFREMGASEGLANAYDFLIQTLIDKGDLKQAQKALEQLEQMRNQLNDKGINNLYLFNKALVLKTSSRSRDRVEAEDILKQIIEDKALSYEITINALLNLCELLLTELRMTNDLSVLEEIDTYNRQLLEIAEKSRSFILFTEIYFLKAKLALLTLDLKTARRFLTQAQRIAERFGYDQLAVKISVEHDNLRNQMIVWDDLKKEEISLSERIKFAGMDEQIKHLLRNRASLTTQIEEDQITVHKERKICIVCKGDILGYMYACRCDALYCDKCARALTEIENACWFCNNPIDTTKPIKPYREEEVGKKGIIKSNYKNPKNDDIDK